jgi:ADP-ribosylglycohydrolase
MTDPPHRSSICRRHAAEKSVRFHGRSKSDGESVIHDRGENGDVARPWSYREDMNAHERAWLSLEGLSVGDAFGERFFGSPEEAFRRMAKREVPAAPWPYTDDTEMAISIVEVLREHGTIHQDVLAARFAKRMQPSRGYGQGTYAILCGVGQGRDWRALTQAGFRGMGSFGNGGAMRSAPLGAFFADKPLDTIGEQARLSAEVTHAHPEGVTGAIAVAVAAALAWRRRADRGPLGAEWIAAVRDAVPAGYTRDAIGDALAVPAGASIIEAASTLGNGSGVTAPDTVPLCLWVAARSSIDFEAALWEMVNAFGDIDTTCAIVGGIVALKVGRVGIPELWVRAREPLPIAPPTTRATASP